MLILPDTNFLIYLVKQKLFYQLDLFSPNYKFIVLDKIEEELEKLAVKNDNAKVVLSVLDTMKKDKIISIVKVEGKADNAIIKTAEKHKTENFAVATLDKELINRLKKIHV
ncbi:hypothetical protein CO154_01940, partial [Candidatus Pacearchaeota archaeon CG_4_9_14_3_um_filter_31_7]